MKPTVNETTMTKRYIVRLVLVVMSIIGAITNTLWLFLCAKCLPYFNCCITDRVGFCLT